MLNAFLPQLLRRQVFILSTHQVVIGKELEVCLRNLQAFFLYILACKDVCVRNQVVFYQFADNFVREWETIAADNAKAVGLCTLLYIVWVLRRCDAMSQTETDVDACVWTSA